jgi:hypothetical protein
MQLSLEVVDVALGSKQLILSVMQSGAGVVEVISLEVAAAISRHQLITHLPDARLQAAFFYRSSQLPFWMSLMMLFLAFT